MNLIGDNGFTAHAERAVQRVEEQEACVHTFAVNIARLRQCGERLHLVVVQHCHNPPHPFCFSRSGTVLGSSVLNGAFVDDERFYILNQIIMETTRKKVTQTEACPPTVRG
jgi:hypothetical protein